MPELPEVETVRRGLAPVMEGARIRRAELRRPDLRFPFPPAFSEALQGRRVVSLGAHAHVVAHIDQIGEVRRRAAQVADQPGHAPIRLLALVVGRGRLDERADLAQLAAEAPARL